MVSATSEGISQGRHLQMSWQSHRAFRSCTPLFNPVVVFRNLHCPLYFTDLWHCCSQFLSSFMYFFWLIACFHVDFSWYELTPHELTVSPQHANNKQFLLCWRWNSESWRLQVQDCPSVFILLFLSLCSCSPPGGQGEVLCQLGRARQRPLCTAMPGAQCLHLT